MQDFCPRINMLKDELWFDKKCQNRAFKICFFKSKIDGIFSKKKSIKNINSGDHFLQNTFLFLTSIFELLYFLKSCPIFDKLQWFPLSILIFGLKSCLFRTHHVSNSTTKMILLSTYVQVHTSYGIAKAIPELEVLEIWWVLKSSVVNCATTCSLEFLVIIGITTLFPLSLVNS